MADPKIKFKRSSVQGKRPTVDQVPLGEAALNTFDGRLYVSKSTDGGITTSVVNLSGFNLQDEGIFVGYANTVNFVGGTVSVGVDTNVGIATVTVTGGGVGIQSAGTVIGYGITTLNFIGAGNTFLVNGSTVDISIQGGGGGTGGDITVQANNTLVAAAQTTLNFAGTGVTAVSIGKTTTITIEPGLVGAAKSAYSFTATAGQTVFNVNYSQGQENVFLNGARLSESEYVATNGSSIVLNEGASAGDVIDVVIYLRGSDPQRNINVTLTPSFNGITTAFTMRSAGNLFSPIDERQILVSVGGVIQQPGIAYTVGTGSSIFFSSAPSIGATCFITGLFSNTVGVPTDAVKLNKQIYNVTGIQTTFTVTNAYTIGYLDVYRNGIRLVDGSDFTATNGSTFDLVTPANASDVVEIVAYKTSLGVLNSLDLTNLKVTGIATIHNELDVGIGGTIFTAIPSGRIGIGTTGFPSNDARLIIRGPKASGTGSEGDIVDIKGGNYNQLRIKHNTTNWSSAGLLLGNSDETINEGYHHSPSGLQASCAVINVSYDALHFGTNNLSRMMIDQDGNVGLGTTAATTIGGIVDQPLNGTPVLSIYGDSPGINIIHNDSNNISGKYSLINFGRRGVTTNPYRAVIGYDQVQDRLKLSAQNEILFYPASAFNAADSAAMMTINSTGVGIGSTTPTEKLQVAGKVVPSQDNTYDLGSSSLRWANIYSADLQLSNEGSKNDVDGTWGKWTIQEGENDLFIINRRTGKKYKFLLEEVK